MSGLTRKLAAHIATYRDRPLDPAALTVAKQCVLDLFGVTLAGLDEPVARILRDEISTNERGRSSIIGFGQRFTAADAALINGATSHALDYDDVHAWIGHPTTAILPAVLAVAEAEGSSGMDVLRAFVAGYETAGCIGSLAMRSHYTQGFHSTGTLGSFGAAAAAALLMNLDEDQTATALGIAGTQAAGLKSMFGTMAKPFHAGRAAANGVLAARLAARGFTANMDVLEVAQGFLATQTDLKPPYDAPMPRPGSVVVDTLFKYHAACYLTHSTIEAVRSLREQLNLSGPEIASIDVHVAAGHLSVCNIPSPQTGLEMKFSLRHTAALAACGRETAAIATYSDENAVDTTLVAVRDRVTVHGDRPQGHDAQVAITTRDGKAAQVSLNVGIPDRDLARQGERLARKFHSLAVPVVGEDQASKLQRDIATLDELPNIGAIMAPRLIRQ